jgi:O-antigen/teichoic acid export membrane protein
VSVTSSFFTALFIYPQILPFLKLRMQFMSERFHDLAGLLKHQLKLGINWIAGFFMFQSFVPTLYYLHGPIVAGKMGASLQIYTAVYAVGYAWSTSVGPRFGMLGASGKFDEIKSLVSETGWRSCLMSLAAGLGALTVILGLRYFKFSQAERFADLYSITLLVLTAIILQLSSIETMAIRFQKTEPFTVTSLICACLIFAGNLLLGFHFSILGVATGFFLTISICMTPVVHSIYVKKLAKLRDNSHRHKN